MKPMLKAPGTTRLTLSLMNRVQHLLSNPTCAATTWLSFICEQTSWLLALLLRWGGAACTYETHVESAWNPGNLGTLGTL